MPSPIFSPATLAPDDPRLAMQLSPRLSITDVTPGRDVTHATSRDAAPRDRSPRPSIGDLATRIAESVRRGSVAEGAGPRASLAEVGRGQSLSDHAQRLSSYIDSRRSSIHEGKYNIYIIMM